VILIQVPPLNDRRDDIPALITHFMKDISEEYKQPVKEIEPAAITALQQYNWTGNIRELRNVVERLIILSDKKITKKDVETYILKP
jgi:two-component system nitrogen regulation response regulator NtrX